MIAAEPGRRRRRRWRPLAQPMNGLATAEAARDAGASVAVAGPRELGDVAARLGDRERFRSFDRLVQQQEQESQAVAARGQLVRPSERPCRPPRSSRPARGELEPRPSRRQAPPPTAEDEQDARLGRAAGRALAEARHARDGARAPRTGLIARRARVPCAISRSLDPEGSARAPKVAAAVRARRAGARHQHAEGA